MLDIVHCSDNHLVFLLIVNHLREIWDPRHEFALVSLSKPRSDTDIPRVSSRALSSRVCTTRVGTYCIA